MQASKKKRPYLDPRAHNIPPRERARTQGWLNTPWNQLAWVLKFFSIHPTVQILPNWTSGFSRRSRRRYKACSLRTPESFLCIHKMLFRHTTVTGSAAPKLNGYRDRKRIQIRGHYVNKVWLKTCWCAPGTPWCVVFICCNFFFYCWIILPIIYTSWTKYINAQKFYSKRSKTFYVYRVVFLFSSNSLRTFRLPLVYCGL